MKKGATKTSRELSNVEVVVLAVYVLGGDQTPVDTEDAAMKANELAPGRFNWLKYPDQVNLEHVRVRLSEAKQPKHGSLLTGGGPKGWHLTPAGAAWASRNIHRAAAGSAGKDLMDRDQTLRRRLRNEEVRIRGLPACTKFMAGEGVSLREAEAVFRVSEYVQGDRRKQLVDRGRSLFIHDEELSPFVEAMAKIVMKGGEEL
jgi:hypothetical protein